MGKNGELFTILKFRTMRPGRTGLDDEWTGEDDPRITRFGRVLRRTHLDELPQVVNILRGELSVVGPRPEQPHYVEELTEKLPFYGMRHLVRPGLTGWAQVKYGYAGDERDALEKLQCTPDGEQGGAWTGEDDPRITRFGGVLRRTHLDELPQVVNILRGELSIVGPRPEQPRYVDELNEKLPFYSMRHLVRPGLTGWAQIKYGYAGDERDALEKLQYEFFYLRRQSLSLDLRIVGRTVRSVLGGDGR